MPEHAQPLTQFSVILTRVLAKRASFPAWQQELAPAPRAPETCGLGAALEQFERGLGAGLDTAPELV